VVALATLAGCTMTQIHRQADSRYANTDLAASARLESARHVEPAESVTDSSLPYVNTTPIAYEAQYPARFDSPANLNAPAQSVAALMRSLQAVSGFAVEADDDLLLSESSARAGGSAAAPAMSLPPPPSDASDAQLAPPVGSFGIGNASGERLHIGAIAYQGSLRGLLDEIAGKLDATWEYESASRTIHFYRYESRVFHIATIPGLMASATDFGGQGGRNVQGGQGQSISTTSSGNRAQYEGKYSVWQVIDKNIGLMLSPSGSLSINEAAASIVVRDRWDRLDKIANYVHTINGQLSTQVKVNVTVYRVTQNDSDSHGINWSAAYNEIAKRAGVMGVTITTPRPTSDGLSSMILSAPTLNKNGNITPFAGSQAFLDALSSIGKTSVVTNSTVSTVNNIAAPVKVFTSKSYLAQSTPLITSGVTGGNSSPVGAGASLTPGSVETGFSMQILPSVQPDGHRVLMQVMLSLSTLDALDPVESGGQMIQVPTVSGRELLQRVWMRSGQSLILAGYESTGSDDTTASPVSKGLWGLIGQRRTSNTHDALVIVITPEVTSNKVAI